ncbi:hypothetical protein CPB85DRAFT_1414454 [Mucidula mucida]|nr:hypothetical protein CPB85DRAFT_1414454 [Mucidula mucida]
MRLAGFVHRDISPGNCLMYERQIKISDLEYARRYESQGKGLAPLTGTPGFMAIEYQRSRHLFLGKAEDRDVLQDLEADYDLTMSDAPDSWFQYNFLHDLEAVVWLYTWHLLDTLPDCLRADDITKLRKGIKRLRDELFDGSLTGSPGRIEFITDLARDVKSSYEAATDMLKEFTGKQMPRRLQKV